MNSRGGKSLKLGTVSRSDFAQILQLLAQANPANAHRYHPSLMVAAPELSFPSMLVLKSLNTPSLREEEKRLNFPLCSEDQAFLLESAAISPFGKGLSTITDPAVRCSLQLDPVDFRICFPTWQSHIQEAATKVAAVLMGVPEADVGVRASLHKFLFYPEGSFFKPHVDTEKERGMFATMVVQLPSQYAGGELRVTYPDGTVHCLDANRTTSFDGGGVCPAHCATIFAHFADLTHEVLPVTKGTRCCLVYNLIWTKSSLVPSICQITDQVMSLVNLLDKVAADDDLSRKAFVLGLGHNYTTRSVSSKGLHCFKGWDAKAAAMLDLAQKRQGESSNGSERILLIARRKKEFCGDCSDDEMWGCDDDEGEEAEETDEEEEKANAAALKGKRKPLTVATAAVKAKTERVIESEPDTSLELVSEKLEVFSAAGHRLAFLDEGFCIIDADVALLDPAMTQVWPQKWRSVESEGYTGNYGPTRTEVYHAWVLLSVPKHCVLKALPTDLCGRINVLPALFSTRALKNVGRRVLRDVLNSIDIGTAGEEQAAILSLLAARRAGDGMAKKLLMTARNCWSCWFPLVERFPNTFLLLCALVQRVADQPEMNAFILASPPRFRYHLLLHFLAVLAASHRLPSNWSSLITLCSNTASLVAAEPTLAAHPPCEAETPVFSLSSDLESSEKIEDLVHEAPPAVATLQVQIPGPAEASPSSRIGLLLETIFVALPPYHEKSYISALAAVKSVLAGANASSAGVQAIQSVAVKVLDTLQKRLEEEVARGAPLKTNAISPSEFSFSRSASVNDPEIARWLVSEAVSIKVVGQFSGIAHARCWASKHFSNNMFHCDSQGVGRKASVCITKTGSHNSVRAERYKTMVKTLNETTQVSARLQAETRKRSRCDNDGPETPVFVHSLAAKN
jgi:hypothetical protein